MNNYNYDRIIIGAGIYGLYAAIQSAKNGYKTLVLEQDEQAITRGSYVNQARLHSGYHYPRSKETAEKSRDYFFRFLNDFSSAINMNFTQLYAISHENSLTTNDNFKKFCEDLNIKCNPVDSNTYFKPGMVDGLYDTLEYAIDNDEIRRILLRKCDLYPANIHIMYNHKVTAIKYINNKYCVYANGINFFAPWLLNATYASTNQILNMLKLETLDIKYEQCEVILCEVSDNIKNVGITVMDGPFFSIMPFGNTGLHSLTSVCHTPHITSYDKTPTYECQNHRLNCNIINMCNCNNCCYAPKSKQDEMLALAKNYLNDDIKINPVKHLFAIKPILNSCEKDDARPTLIKTYKNYPNFYTVFSGKLNTIYDLDAVLK